MSKSFPKYKAAATQLSPVYLNLQKSVEKACDAIEEAARNGAKLIGFPEGYLCGYPWWIFMGPPFPYGVKFYKQLYRNAVSIPGPEVAAIAACAKKNGIYVCISCTELGGGTLYLTQLWFDDRGNLMGKHRKTRATNGERTIWGEGDGSMMPVFQTALGNLGGLMCWEHRMPSNLMIMNAKNEQVHVASWPAGNANDDHVFASRANIIASQYYASTVGTFVLMCSSPNDAETRDILTADNPELETYFDLGCGHAGIINTAGKYLTDIIPHDQEGIMYAELDLSEIIEFKYLMDCSGHYSKSSVAQIIYNQEPQDAVRFVGKPKEMFIPFDSLDE